MRQTALIAIVCMSISGMRVLNSIATQTTRMPSPTASSASVLGDPQPHTDALLIPSSTPSSPDAITNAPNQSIRPPGRSGDSGIHSHAARTVGMIVASGNQNSQ